ncbi:cobalamin ABC transporter ATP-binding protein [Brachybacterium sp. P6-10-X1]|uniref:SIP domain-containing protein n=1 Tax=Brachybacterium sp. P6-10-X1 TaxID=1903186 RepID=UPI0009717E5B|nr:SIP domain-containing protein [Brachybacterium sp. P6-10-X1]APX34778.1 cobalamin ABC transporter ATP-binding protein [Brachybacterium sp. P6-10-X1]
MTRTRDPLAARPADQDAPPRALLEARRLHLAYDRREVVHDLSLGLPEGRITIIVGANGSGKSTVLRGLSRLMTPRRGDVLLDGTDIHSLGGKSLARRLGLLPQSPQAPDGVTVRELVSRGRFPHQGLVPRWHEQDERAVQEALAATRSEELTDRPVSELSGGQRQRVWIAMALAQETEVLLLDEPTTYLDVTHQLEVLDVVRELNRRLGTTVGIVLHDLGLAARYADHLVAVLDGEIHSEGAPADVITAPMVREVFDLDALVVPDPVTGSPMVLPLGRESFDADVAALRPAAARDVPDPRTAPDHTAAEDRSAPAVTQEDAMTTTTQATAAAAHRAATAASASAAAVATTTVPALAPALEASPQLAYELRVGAITPIGKNLLRFTLTSPDLVHFGAGGHPLDMRIKLIIPGPEELADHFAAVRPGALLDPATHAEWYRTWLRIDPADRGWMRTYTVRAQRGAGHPGNLTEHPEIDIDVVLHLDAEELPGSGVAARWARDARVGDTISMLGPNRHVVGPDYGGIEFRPGAARTVLLIGDETAAPAICSILEALPESIAGHAVIEVPDASDQQQVLTRSGVQVTWLARGERPHGELMTAEVRRLMCEGAQAFRIEAGLGLDGTGDTSERAELEDIDIDSSILWETTTGHGAFYAWLAGEAGTIKTLRRHLVSELGIDRRQVSFMGYWRQGRPEG